MQTLDVTDFIVVLKAIGFKHDPLPHETLAEEPSDCETDCWELVLQGSESSDGMMKRLTVQLWSDGKHRVSHMKAAVDAPRWWRGTSPPTAFLTPLEMISAIHREMEK